MEAIKRIETFEDRTKIKTVHTKYPDLLGTDFENQIKERYAQIISIESEISNLRERINELEQLLFSKKKEFKILTELCDLEFETYTKEITDYKTVLLLKNVGNDIIGHKDS